MTPQTGIDVYGLGQCSMDYLAPVDVYPGVDTKCEFTGLSVQGGGPVANALVALSRWGMRCAYAGVVGDDGLGADIRKGLAVEGIDTAGLLSRTASRSQFAFIAAERQGGRRTIFWQRPTGPALSAAEVDTAAIGRTRVFHTDGLYVAAAVAGCRAARAAGATVVLDAGTLREGVLEVVALTDCCIVSEAFARRLVGDSDPEAACDRLARMGPAMVGVTLGEKGYVALCGDRFITGPAYPVAAVDTTGCGDIFHAGVIYGLLKKWPYDRALDFAAWAAAMAATRLGGRDGIPDVALWPGQKTTARAN
ncbi:MAG: PfkB family carbohydrate kinase [Pseudomonadota bacterium]